MKKIVTAAAVLAAMSVLTVSAFADVYVSIADENGNIVAAQEAVPFEDADGDGTVTVNDALILAHDKLFEGGAEAGYGSATGDYGLMLTKLWGVENGGSYGYYVNNTAAMGLADELNDEDFVNAFVYTDLTAWSDTYCYFDRDHADFDIHDNETPTFDLTLKAAAFDENWSPITVPVAGAKITINFEETEFVTDENGFVSITLPEGTPNPNIANDNFDYIISAESDSQTLVPPVCTVKVNVFEDDSAEAQAEEAAVEAAPAEEAAPVVTAEVTAATGDVAAAAETSKGSPDTGIADTAAVAGLAVVAAGALIISKKRK